MNIFYIDKDPYKSATMMVNTHVVKMILETCQLLSTAHRVLDGKPSFKEFGYADGTLKRKKWLRLPDDREYHLYGATHINHPSAKWARECAENYYWLVDHLNGLLKEYTYRYDKHHKCEKLLKHLSITPTNISLGKFTPPPCAMDACYIISDDAVENYRYYYKVGKNHLHTWKKRSPPEWIL